MGLFSRLKQRNSLTRNDLRVMNSVKLVRDTLQQPAAAVSLKKLADSGSSGVSLSKAVQVAGVSLRKRNLVGIRGKAVLVLDHSGSMEQLYKQGVVQRLVERALAFGLQVDVDGEVLVLPFDTRVRGSVRVNVDNYRNVVNKHIWAPRDMGLTRLDLAINEVNKLAAASTQPIFAIVITDGNPYEPGVDAECLATRSICESSQYPVFVKFLAVEEVQYLIDLDEDDSLPRLLDNVNTQFFSGRRGEGNHRPQVTSSECTDEVFIDAMLEELDLWIGRAQHTNPPILV